MSRKSYLEQACAEVPAFKTISDQFLRKYNIAGKSDSWIKNYLMQISKMVLHYKCSPLELTIYQMEEYLFYLRQNDKPSMSSFKHLVYGLRTLFAMFKQEELRLSLPPISHSKSLPVVFSQREIRQILKTTKLLKHLVLFAIIYDCGLRISEVIILSSCNKRDNLEMIRSSLQVKEELKPRLTRAQVLSDRWGERSELHYRECGGELYLWKSFQRNRAPPLSA